MSQATSAFAYKNGELYCDAVAARTIADAVGTPTYIYRGREILARYREFGENLGHN